jgi:hypothetical protein
VLAPHSVLVALCVTRVCCCQVDTEGLRKLHPVDAAAISRQPKLTEMDLQAVLNNDSTYLRVSGRGSGRDGSSDSVVRAVLCGAY